MFYLSGNKRGNHLGVVDTKDNVEEFYTSEFLSTLNVEIIRFNKELEIGFKFKTKCFEFTLVNINNLVGWKLRYTEGNNIFRNKSSYLGYPVISLEECFKSYENKSIDVGGMDTSNVTNMNSMFALCGILTSLDLSNFNTTNVTDMSAMFYCCESLTSLDLSNFNTINVTSMRNMFYHCASLTSLDLSNFNTSNVTDMSYMFSHCESLTFLDLSNFNTSNVTNMSFMFSFCESLTFLDLSSFSTSNVTDMYSMFFYRKSLLGIKIGNDNNLYKKIKDLGIYLLVPKTLGIDCKEEPISDLKSLISKLRLSGVQDKIFSY